MWNLGFLFCLLHSLLNFDNFLVNIKCEDDWEELVVMSSYVMLRNLVDSGNN